MHVCMFNRVVMNMEIIDQIIDKPQDKDIRNGYVVSFKFLFITGY